MVGFGCVYEVLGVFYWRDGVGVIFLSMIFVYILFVMGGSGMLYCVIWFYVVICDVLVGVVCVRIVCGMYVLMKGVLLYDGF